MGFPSVSRPSMETMRHYQARTSDMVDDWGNHETLPLWRFQFIVFLMRYKWEHNLTKLSWGKDMEV